MLSRLRQNKTVCPVIPCIKELDLYRSTETNNHVELWLGDDTEIYGEALIYGEEGNIVVANEDSDFPTLELLFESVCKPLCVREIVVTGKNTSYNEVQITKKMDVVRRLRIASFTRLR
jgi:hypothetical protein